MLGGGVAGMAAALSLAAMDFEVTLVEKAAVPGGRAVGYACKATDRCLHCGVCLASDLAEELAASPVVLRTGTRLEGLEGRPGDFRATVTGAELAVGALVVATGLAPAPAAGWPDLGYGRLDAVITASELEERCRRQGPPAARRVAFVQCVGSRNPAWGKGYCSEVCCPYALRLGLGLVAEAAAEVTVFFNDLQTAGKSMATAREQARKGLRLVQGVPSRAAGVAAGVELQFEDVRAGGVRREGFDLVVLSTGIWPGPDTAALARLLGINTGPTGFFAGHPGQSWRSSRPGIYLAGSCQKPRGIADSIAHGRAAAAQVAADLEEVRSA